MFAKLISRTVLISAIPVATATKGNENEPAPRTLFKPQDLPIYTTVFGKDNQK